MRRMLPERMGCGLHGFNEGDQQGLSVAYCLFPPASAIPGCDRPFTVCSACFRQQIEAQTETLAQKNCPARNALIFCCMNSFGV